MTTVHQPAQASAPHYLAWRLTLVLALAVLALVTGLLLGRWSAPTAASTHHSTATQVHLGKSAQVANVSRYLCHLDKTGRLHYPGYHRPFICP